MKILAKVTERKFICEIGKDEIEKVFMKYYDKLGDIHVGDDIFLSQGYDFRVDITSACSEMISANKKFQKAQDTLLRFSTMIVEKGVKTDD